MASSASENDLGAAASALFHLHTSPLVVATNDLRGRFLNMNLPLHSNGMPALSLGEVVAGEMPVLNLEGESRQMSTSSPLGSMAPPQNPFSRPRSVSWDPGFSSLSLFSLLPVEHDTTAAGALCALMKSPSPVGAAAVPAAGRNLRPRSQSTSAAVLSSKERPQRVRPRSTSVSSAQNAMKKPSRPRSYSQSSRISTKSMNSARSNGGSKRTMSFDSASTDLRREYFDEEFDWDHQDDFEGEDDGHEGASFIDDLQRVGKYSPDSRRKRIEKFLEKRRRRIWRKRIKYDVRKNFADSRLRVKGRFVRKEDEEQLREYMQMT